MTVFWIIIAAWYALGFFSGLYALLVEANKVPLDRESPLRLLAALVIVGLFGPPVFVYAMWYSHKVAKLDANKTGWMLLLIALVLLGGCHSTHQTIRIQTTAPLARMECGMVTATYEVIID